MPPASTPPAAEASTTAEPPAEADAPAVAEVIDAAQFAALLDPLGPFEPSPRVAVAVSGGADSMALCLLAQRWAAARGGGVQALICDHGLRAGSAAEAAVTHARLAALGIGSEILPIAGLDPGPALAERARAARYATLEAACARLGIVHLLLGHHAADQAETVVLRLLHASGPAGLAAMAALVERPHLRLLRPLLTVPSSRLRASLIAAGIGWVEDPTNADPTYERARLRLLRRDLAGDGVATYALVAAAAARGIARMAAEGHMATWAASHVTLYPTGHAILREPEAAPEAGLARLLQVLAGVLRPPPARQVASWIARPRAATLGGVLLRPVSHGEWLLAREAAALRGAVAARVGAVWDGRFRCVAVAEAGLTLAAFGSAAATWRNCSPLPAAVLATLPAVWRDGVLVDVPSLPPMSSHKRPVSLTFASSASLSPLFVPAGLPSDAVGMHKRARLPIL